MPMPQHFIINGVAARAEDHEKQQQACHDKRQPEFGVLHMNASLWVKQPKAIIAPPTIWTKLVSTAALFVSIRSWLELKM